jgi:hypothetical protein
MFGLKIARQPVIRFTCDPADHGVIAPPVPAKQALPEWFRRLPPADPAHVSATDNALTVKRCMPFLDAMITGWIIPLAATVRLEIRDEGHTVDAGWEFDKTMVSNHSAHQVKGNPREHRPPCKFHNHWTIATPPGWSCLFVQPLNRHQPVFEIMAGVVDTDTYRSPIHFPFFATGPDGVHTLEKGTPMVQVIPFRRETTLIKAEIGPQTATETADSKRIARLTQASEGWYRKEARAAR